MILYWFVGGLMAMAVGLLPRVKPKVRPVTAWMAYEPFVVFAGAVAVGVIPLLPAVDGPNILWMGIGFMLVCLLIGAYGRRLEGEANS